MNIMPIRQFGKKPEKNMREAPLIITKGGRKAFIVLPYSMYEESVKAEYKVTPSEPYNPLLTITTMWYNKPMFTNRFKVLILIIFLFAALSLYTLVFVTLSQRVDISLNYSKQAYINSNDALKIVNSIPTATPTATPAAVFRAPAKSTTLIIKTPIK